MGIGKTTYPPIQGPVVTFDFTEFATGVGYVSYYGANTREVTTDDYILGVNATDQSHWTSTAIAMPNDGSKFLDLDFDVQFLVAADIQGLMRANLTLGAHQTSSTSDNSWSMNAIVKLRKWDGSTETEIANATTATLSATNGELSAGQFKSKMMAVELDATSAPTHFGRGDVLRVTVEVYGTVINTRAAGGIGHDPLNRDDTDEDNSNSTQIIKDADNTNLIFQIPFRNSDT